MTTATKLATVHRSVSVVVDRDQETNPITGRVDPADMMLLMTGEDALADMTIARPAEAADPTDTIIVRPVEAGDLRAADGPSRQAEIEAVMPAVAGIEAATQAVAEPRRKRDILS